MSKFDKADMVVIHHLSCSQANVRTNSTCYTRPIAVEEGEQYCKTGKWINENNSNIFREQNLYNYVREMEN